MRERTIEEIEVGKEKDYYDVLRLYNEVSENVTVFSYDGVRFHII